MEKKCSNCMYLDYKNSQGSFFIKYFCGKIQRYVSGDTSACAAYMERQHSSCYLTTACVEQKGLADDCIELSTLRTFRDTYVAKLENGQELIQKYYETAPRIVDVINGLDNKEEIYNEIYQYILSCVEYINKKDYDYALVLYVQMVEKLSERYL